MQMHQLPSLWKAFRRTRPRGGDLRSGGGCEGRRDATATRPTNGKSTSTRTRPPYRNLWAAMGGVGPPTRGRPARQNDQAVAMGALRERLPAAARRLVFGVSLAG